MRAFVVVGMGFGDEGKGTIVDHLVRRESADLVVRFNGGAQAGHNVVVDWPERDRYGHPTGELVEVHHEFRQFGSGSFSGARTHLSRFSVVYPEMLFREAEELGPKIGRWPWAGLSIDRLAAITTPFHVAANRIREVARGGGRHGSTGYGIWETEMDRRSGHGLIMQDLRNLDERTLARRLCEIQDRKRAEVRDLVHAGDNPLGPAHHLVHPLSDTREIPALVEIYKILAGLVEVTDGLPESDVAVFEGAQGILLDERVGFHPYTTGSRTTAANAISELGSIGASHDDFTVVGVTRSYSTRHGRGPFPGGHPDVDHPEPHNVYGPWQEGWRQGALDCIALEYAVRCEPDIDEIAVTHIDRAEVCELWPYVDAWWDPLDHNPKYVPFVPATRDHQEWQTRTVERCIGRLDVMRGSEVAEFVADATGKPVTILSRGPTHADKENIERLEAAA